MPPPDEPEEKVGELFDGVDHWKALSEGYEQHILSNCVSD